MTRVKPSWESHTSMLGANKHHEKALIGATQLLIGLYALPLSPNNHPRGPKALLVVT